MSLVRVGDVVQDTGAVLLAVLLLPREQGRQMLAAAWTWSAGACAYTWVYAWVRACVSTNFLFENGVSS